MGDANLTEELLQFVKDSGGGEIPAEMASALDKWRAATAGDWSPGDCIGCGCYAPFSDMTSCVEFECAHDWVSGRDYDELEALSKNPSNDVAVRKKLIELWLAVHFENPDQDGIVAYTLHEVRIGPKPIFVLVEYDGEFLEENGSAFAAFASSEDAQRWLRSQGILDFDWVNSANMLKEIDRAFETLAKGAG